MRALVAASVASLLVAPCASALDFPARSGESGILDVPDAEAAGLGVGQVAAEIRFDHSPGLRDDFGPLPIYAVAGVTSRLDVGLTAREWGQPGDPRPARVLFGAAAKLQLLRPQPLFPGAALGFVADRLNDHAVLGARLALSTDKGIYRVAAFGGAEAGGDDLAGAGLTAGVAASLAVTKAAELAAEALIGPRGDNVGLAVRWKASRTVGLSLGGNYFPRDEAYRVSLAIAFSPTPKPPIAKREPEAVAAPPEETAAAAAPVLAGRPRFRLRIPLRNPALLAAPRHLQRGPFTPSAGGGPALPAAGAPGLRGAAPNLEDLAEAQLREQEALADARERRVRGTAERLDARENSALEEGRRLDESERELAAREQQLAARDRRIAVRGPPTQQQRQLESLEAQLQAQERQLVAQERSLAPTVDAAQGRERDAASREDAERQEANRLAASVSGASSRALQLEIRKQALGARNRQLSALEARLVARGERIDAFERQLRTRAERLDAWTRRLDARGEILDLIEKKAAESRSPAPAASDATAESKDKAVFVTVVKSPTAIVRERAAAPTTATPGSALHPGVAVEKAVAAATVVMFPTPESQLSELDRETVDNIAKLAAKERCELLIWARAKNPGLMAEAQRRAAEVRALVLAAGPLATERVVTRITTRPGAQGVDVVVSALRETAKAAPTADAPQTPTLLSGESGKRQVREALQAAQSSIETCVGRVMQQKKLARAEGVLKLTISPRGSVARVSAGTGDLSGTAMEECLNDASGNWLFPPADTEYVVDVPITVIRGGAR